MKSLKQFIAEKEQIIKKDGVYAVYPMLTDDPNMVVYTIFDFYGYEDAAADLYDPDDEIDGGLSDSTRNQIIENNTHEIKLEKDDKNIPIIVKVIYPVGVKSDRDQFCEAQILNPINHNTIKGLLKQNNPTTPPALLLSTGYNYFRDPTPEQLASLEF